GLLQQQRQRRERQQRREEQHRRDEQQRHLGGVAPSGGPRRARFRCRSAGRRHSGRA
ncbi:MAG: hypothetical protein AVDCRST_MAG93-1070, partial [uncultured Chloroflexia bacterium]